MIMLFAEQIKTILIEYLLSEYKTTDKMILSELLFGYKKRSADVVMVNSNNLYAYEIKSDRDRIDTLELQISDYLTVFDYVSVVTGYKYSDLVEKKLPTEIGIYIVKNEKIEQIREPMFNKNKDIHNIMMFFNKNELLKIFDLKRDKNLYTDQLREIIENNVDFDIVKKKAIEVLKNRYLHNYKLFLNEKGDKIHREDLFTISRKKLSKHFY